MRDPGICLSGVAQFGILRLCGPTQPFFDLT
jgi:hypothetical protein